MATPTRRHGQTKRRREYMISVREGWVRLPRRTESEPLVRNYTVYAYSRVLALKAVRNACKGKLIGVKVGKLEGRRT